MKQSIEYCQCQGVLPPKACSSKYSLNGSSFPGRNPRFLYVGTVADRRNFRIVLREWSVKSQNFGIVIIEEGTDQVDQLI